MEPYAWCLENPPKLSSISLAVSELHVNTCMYLCTSMQAIECVIFGCCILKVHGYEMMFVSTEG